MSETNIAVQVNIKELDKVYFLNFTYTAKHLDRLQQVFSMNHKAHFKWLQSTINYSKTELYKTMFHTNYKFITPKR